MLNEMLWLRETNPNLTVHEGVCLQRVMFSILILILCLQRVMHEARW